VRFTAYRHQVLFSSIPLVIDEFPTICSERLIGGYWKKEGAGPAIISLKRGGEGVLQGVRDITLKPIQNQAPTTAIGI
jgi:hypothetical protein